MWRAEVEIHSHRWLPLPDKAAEKKPSAAFLGGPLICFSLLCTIQGVWSRCEVDQQHGMRHSACQ